MFRFRKNPHYQSFSSLRFDIVDITTLYYVRARIPPHPSFAKVATESTNWSSPILLHQCEGWAVRLGLTSQISIKTKTFVFIILFTYTILTFVWFLQNIKTYDEPWTDGVKAEFLKKLFTVHNSTY